MKLLLEFIEANISKFNDFLMTIIRCNNDVNGIKDAVNVMRSKGKNYYQQACVDRANLLFEKDTNIQKYLELFYTLTEK